MDVDFSLLEWSGDASLSILLVNVGPDKFVFLVWIVGILSTNDAVLSASFVAFCSDDDDVDGIFVGVLVGVVVGIGGDTQGRFFYGYNVSISIVTSRDIFK